jgi:hypothetical protein
MRRISTIAVALGCASLLASHALAQSDEIKTRVKTDVGSTVHYTGCVQSGADTRTYMLEHVAPVVSRTTTTNFDGSTTTTTTTTYSLVPESTVELQQHIGHKVEVTGVLIPAGKGDAKIRTKTEVNGKEEETKTEVKRGNTAQLRVVSVKPLGETCSVN